MKFKHIIIIVLLFSIGLNQKLMGNQVFSNDTIPKTVLSIVQGKDSLVITDKTKEIVLSTDSFKLYFTTQNTDCVFLNCSYDSMAYHYASINQLEKIDVFTPPQTFAENSKNQDHDLSVVNNASDGYHCLYAFSEDEEFIRFDQVLGTTKANWIGLRSVSSIFEPGKSNLALKDIKGKTLYLIYSPGIENKALALKIMFK
jgi:hypothetical protein